jgi:DNA-binding MarR family transcriptional regulator
VARRRRADDERAVSVELTAAGRELEARAAAVPAALASCLLSGEDEYLRLKSLFADLVARLEEGPAKGT